MKVSAQAIAVSLFFIGCLALGGASNGGYLANLSLQFFAIGFALVVWVKSDAADRLAVKSTLTAAGIFAVALVIFQFLPVPIDVWEKLPGRQPLAADLALLGLTPSPTLITLQYHETIKAFMWLIPAAGLFFGLSLLKSIPFRSLAATLVGFGFISIALGLLQFFGDRNGWAYLYEITNRGSMVGFFANSNHMATLLLAVLPFLAALVRNQAQQNPENQTVIKVIGTLLVGIVVLSIGLIGSMTGYGLAVPVIALSLLIIYPISLRLSLLAILPAFLAGGTVIMLSEEGDHVFEEPDEASYGLRDEIFSNTWEAALDYFPAGSGLGTFPDIYPMYENQSKIGRTYINHAHNDYLELLLELGLAGVLALAAFMGWWLRSSVSIWRNRQSSPFLLASTIASGIILLHSVWDYPLRTAAIGCVFALCCAMMATRNKFAETTHRA